jgi:hypothetical protein
VRVKLKLQWRTLECGHTRNMEHLLRKAEDSKQSQPKKGHLGYKWQGHRG